jgi:hypothetical protein
MFCRSFQKYLCAALLFTSSIAASVAYSADDKDARQADALPLQKLVMFNAGVGFFEHRGKVDGNAQVEFKFKVEEINDLLKSMVLQDLGGGQISTVTYGSKDPITRTLQTFAVNLTNNPTLGDILNQIRGEQVELDADKPITGVILGVEKKKKPAGKEGETVDVEIINLLTDSGLRAVPLDSVAKIKISNEKLDAELREALKVLAMAHSTDKKSVTLDFLGAGKRPVRVGYIQQTPVWKTSYRLVLKDNEQPFLQGWAIVENTTENDWKDVELTLVSGRPISFIMDLYQPLYVSRPLVQPELYASLRPQVYGQDLVKDAEEFARKAEPAAPAIKPAREELAKRSGLGRDRANRGLALGDGVAKGGVAFDAPAFTADLSLQEGVKSVAQAGDVGELFEYRIANPVSLPRQQSAMLPIVNDSVKGEKLSIYNQNVQPKHPLNGLRLKNSTDLHLMQGPITVFDGGVYAGDARIEDLQPGTERLVSYALDLDVEVAPETVGHPQQILSVSLVKGVMNVSLKNTRTQKYKVKNSAKKAKNMLVEYPLDANWKLVTPKEPSEKTRDLYRFAVNAEPGKPTELVVEEEQITRQEHLLTNLDDNTILFYVNQKVTSDKVKEALKSAIEKKRQIEKTVADRQKLEQQIATITQEQDRIRQNMPQLDRNSDLYKRYVKKFGDQEDQVEKLRTKIQELVEQEAKQRKELDEFLVSLDLS